MSYLLGIDAGTTSMKVALFDVDGLLINSFTEEYQLETPVLDWVELDPDFYWQSCVRGIRAVIDSSGVASEKIKALAISSQGETLITLDKNGEPLRKAIVWLDNRSKEEAEAIAEKFGTKETYLKTGSPEIVPTWASTKIMWLRKNEPSVFENTYKFLLVEDFLIYKLTGKFIGSFALYTSSLLIDIIKRKYWEEMLEFLKIKPAQLPELRESAEVVKNVTDEAAQLTGLSTHTLVVTGGMDQPCGATGSGNIKPGIVTENTGASLNICATVSTPVFDPKQRIPVQCHILKNRYLLLPWCQTAGMVLKWFREGFCSDLTKEAELKKQNVYDMLTERASKIAPGSDGLIMLPHLAGAMCPEFNLNAKGVFFGVTLKHDKNHFVRAIMESIGYMLRSNIDILEEMGVEIAEVISTGGASKSALWNQIKSDILQKPIITLSQQESCCLGAAILAGVGSGVFETVEEASSRMVNRMDSFVSNDNSAHAYSQAYEKYLALYDSLEKLFE